VDCHPTPNKSWLKPDRPQVYGDVIGIWDGFSYRHEVEPEVGVLDVRCLRDMAMASSWGWDVFWGERNERRDERGDGEKDGRGRNARKEGRD